jgi:hypothetical protein
VVAHLGLQPEQQQHGVQLVHHCQLVLAAQQCSYPASQKWLT